MDIICICLNKQNTFQIQCSLSAKYAFKQISLHFEKGEHSTAYLTSRSYSIQLCNYYTVIYTMLLLRSLKVDYKKITLPSIVVLMV